jgi:hypothetical protein
VFSTKKKTLIEAKEGDEPPRKMAAAKYKKAPDAPKRFKSAFIIFSAEKHKEIKEDLAKQGRAEKVSHCSRVIQSTIESRTVRLIQSEARTHL